MTPKEYWEGDPNLAKAYRDAYAIKKDTRNHEMWFQGMYIYDGLLAALARQLYADKRATYPSEPYRFKPQTEEDKEKEAERERQKFIANMNAFESAWKRQHGK